MGTIEIEGVDYAFPPHPDIPGLAAEGIQFACRYGGAGTSDKWLTREEAQLLTSFGIAIVANVEGDAAGLARGWDTGYAWAAKADAHFQNLGMPADRPIYLSVDFDPNLAEMAKVAQALAGAAAALGGVHRVGVYGGIRTLNHMRNAGVASWFWQTYAWSGGQWAPFNHLEQYNNGVYLGGAQVDLNRANTPDYGQWGVDDMLTDAQVTLFNTVFSQMAAEREMKSHLDWSGSPNDIGTEALHVQTWARIDRNLVQVKELLEHATGEPIAIDYDKLAAAIVAQLPPLRFEPTL